MDFLIQIINNPVGPAHLTILFSLVIWLGVKLGKLKFGGISLGVTFILFVGILVGHLYNAYVVVPNIDDNAFVTAMANQKLIINFVKEFGLILFVYCIGIQVGPSFFATFRKGGVSMNILSTVLILLNVAVMLGLFFLIYYKPDAASNKENLAMLTGAMCGAVTNTPALGAATSIVPKIFGGQVDFSIANGYACAYPLGVVGIIGATIFIRKICKVQLDKEAADFEASQQADPTEVPERFYVEVENEKVIGKSLRNISQIRKQSCVCSRYKKDGQMFIPNGDTIMEKGMKLLVVSPQMYHTDIANLFGKEIQEDWSKEIENKDSEYNYGLLVVTKPEIEGKTLTDLRISSLYNVNVTRITRSGITIFAAPNFRLKMGDHIRVVGAANNIESVKKLIGNKQQGLDIPNVGMIFLGILLGILLGQIPIPIPGVAIPVKLGLAGGPLVVAILFGAFGYKLHISSFITSSANLMMREIGLALFLAGVGIQAGASFWHTVQNGGLNYVWIGFIITVLPILICGIYGRVVMKINYFTLMGLIAGTNTDPPALAFANQTAGNGAPALGYSTVYPLSMFLRILMAQLVLLIIIPLL